MDFAYVMAGCITLALQPWGYIQQCQALLNYAIVVGTQIKMDMPGKASTIALVDTIEPPIVRLDDGKVIQVPTVEQAERIRPTSVRSYTLATC